ncbi:hypothetical protein ACLOAV_010836 [Pseudogymnoascus australis]
MTEILRVNDLQVDKARSDILGSLSHELRSPLHGNILSAELLGDTRLSVFQGNAAYTIKLCSRTLLDTIDHLLDYFKINSFARKGNKSKASRGTQAVVVVDDPGQLGEKKLTCDTRLGRLIEEVIERVFAGYTFQYLSITQPSARQGESVNRDAIANHQPNPMQTMRHFDPIPATGVRLSQEFGEVSVILSIDARQNWSYFVQVGAFSHTGKGIGPDFLQHDVFRPFSQEGTLTPGTGLGFKSCEANCVAIARRSLGAASSWYWDHSSRHPPIGAGFAVSRKDPSVLRRHQMFEEQVRDLKGLRIGLSLSSHNGDGDISDWQKPVPDIRREWLMMEVVTNMHGTTTADILLWSHDELPSLSEDIEALAKTPIVVNASRRFPKQLIMLRSLNSFLSQLVHANLLGPVPCVYTMDECPCLPDDKLCNSIISKRPERPHRTQSSFTMTNTSGPAGGRMSSYPHTATSGPTDDNDTSVFSNVKDEILANLTTPNVYPTSTSPDLFSKFLLVDDNHINLKALSTYMKKLGLQYDIAMNGNDLFCLPDRTYTCVLMIISMPVMDGFFIRLE